MSEEPARRIGGSADHEVPPGGGRIFLHVLINTAVANMTTNFLWWGLTFWAYLETRSVLATGIIGGVYMLLAALLGMLFGSLVDRYRKHRAMLVASLTTLVSFAAAGLVYLAIPEETLADLGGPWFWIFGGIILFGGVIENMRNIALSTTVTLLVPPERHARANGLVGTVIGMVFVITSVFSGLSLGILGMGWTLLIAIVMTAGVVIHLLFLSVPEEKPVLAENTPIVDVRGGLAAIRQVPGLFALIIFSTFNNLVGGTHWAMVDAYGIEMFGVQVWGGAFAISATGFIVGGLIVARFGLGKNPVRVLVLLVAGLGLMGAVFTLREWGWLLIGGLWVYMVMSPIIEAAEQTIIQRVVPFRTQGRVFGFAQALESAAAPISSFLVAPIAQFLVIPYMRTPEGQDAWGWLVGDGDSRGIALVFAVTAAIIMVISLFALASRSYRLISLSYASAAIENPDEATPDPHDAAPAPR